ncbi:MAG: FlgD immunoglobulin-like domain containing protein [Candidatus Krumholzibacteriia bacterium]
MRVLTPLLSVLLLFTLAVPAFGGTSVEDKAIIGPYCFQMDRFADTWQWRVDSQKDGYFQVTGYDRFFGDAPMTGGGYKTGNLLHLTVAATDWSRGWRCVHAVEIDLTTFTGVSDFTWYDETGMPTTYTYTDEPFHQVPCTNEVDAALPPSRPLAADEVRVPADPAQVGIMSLTGWHDFKLDSYTDTWHLFFQDLGSGVHQVTGYDTVYAGSAMYGGGMQVGTMLYLTVRESEAASGSRCLHGMALDLTTMTGTSTFIWKDYQEAPFVAHWQLPFHEVVPAAEGKGTDQPASLPGYVPPSRDEVPVAVDEEALKSILGSEFCFKMDAYADLWRWKVDQVAGGYFQVTGRNASISGEAMDGGGWRQGNMVYLAVQTARPSSGQRALWAVAFDLAAGTGTADGTWTNVDGAYPYPYFDEPFHRVICSEAAGSGEGIASGMPPVEKEESADARPLGLDVVASPNPFNPLTKVAFTLPVAARAQVVVYDAAGRQVRVLADDLFPAGTSEIAWTGRDDAGRAAASGVYFAVVRAGDLRESVRLLLLK